MQESSWENGEAKGYFDILKNHALTRCGLVTPYGDINLSQYSLR